jgi:hypothetical protein
MSEDQENFLDIRKFRIHILHCKTHSFACQTRIEQSRAYGIRNVNIVIILRSLFMFCF